jgi:transcriptional regulator with XRE-family HTH domain
MAEVLDFMSVGSRLRQAREEMDLTRDELARLASELMPGSSNVMTKRSIEAYERDDRFVPMYKAAALCSVLSLDPLALLAEVALSGNADLTRQIKPVREESGDFAESSYNESVPGRSVSGGPN